MINITLQQAYAIDIILWVICIIGLVITIIYDKKNETLAKLIGLITFVLVIFAICFFIKTDMKSDWEYISDLEYKYVNIVDYTPKNQYSHLYTKW